MAVSPYSDWRSIEVKQELRAELKSALEAQRDLLTVAGEGRHEKALLRIDAIQKAAKTFEDNLIRVPTQLDREVQRLSALFDEKLARLNLRIDNFHVITELNSSASSTAVTKSEGVMTKEIETIKVLITSTSDSFDTKIDNLTDRLNRGEGVWAGGRGVVAAIVAAIGSAALVVTMYVSLSHATPSVSSDVRRIDDIIARIDSMSARINSIQKPDR